MILIGQPWEADSGGETADISSGEFVGHHCVLLLTLARWTLVLPRWPHCALTGTHIAGRQPEQG